MKSDLLDHTLTPMCPPHANDVPPPTGLGGSSGGPSSLPLIKKCNYGVFLPTTLLRMCPPALRRHKFASSRYILYSLSSLLLILLIFVLTYNLFVFRVPLFACLPCALFPFNVYLKQSCILSANTLGMTRGCYASARSKLELMGARFESRSNR